MHIQYCSRSAQPRPLNITFIHASNSRSSGLPNAVWFLPLQSIRRAMSEQMLLINVNPLHPRSALQDTYALLALTLALHSSRFSCLCISQHLFITAVSFAFSFRIRASQWLHLFHILLVLALHNGRMSYPSCSYRTVFHSHLQCPNCQCL